jgi:hypothetical protein
MGVGLSEAIHFSSTILFTANENAIL